MSWNDAPDYTPQWSKKDWVWVAIIIGVISAPVLLWLVFDVWLGLPEAG